MARAATATLDRPCTAFGPKGRPLEGTSGMGARKGGRRQGPRPAPILPLVASVGALQRPDIRRDAERVHDAMPGPTRGAGRRVAGRLR
jgi:hypothetical protein